MDLKKELGEQYNTITNEWRGLDDLIEDLAYNADDQLTDESVLAKRNKLKSEIRVLLQSMKQYAETAAKLKGSPVYGDDERNTILRNAHENLDGWLERMPDLEKYLEELPFLSDEYALEQIIKPIVEEIKELESRKNPDDKLIQHKIDQLHQYWGYNYEEAQFDKEFQYPFRYGDASFEYWYLGEYGVLVGKVEKEMEKMGIQLLPVFTLDFSSPREVAEYIFDKCLSQKYINPIHKTRFINAFSGTKIVRPIPWLGEKKGQLCSMVGDLKNYVVEDQQSDWKRAEELFSSAHFDTKNMRSSANVGFTDFDECRKYLKDL